MHDTELIKLATAFRTALLEGRSSRGKCFIVSAPLASLLQFHGMRASVAEADLGGTSHFWVALDDGRVLDATLDQFEGIADRPLPAIYLGPPIEFHRSALAAAAE